MTGLKRLTLAAGAAGALALGTVSHFEGKENTAYVDPVGVVTVCYGHTATARIGQTHSDEECEELLAGDLGDAFAAVDEHVEVELPPTRRAALASFVFNVGEGAFQRSTLLERLNAGQVVEACNELSRWVYAGGEQLPGLVRRRDVERWMCLYDEYATLVAGDDE
ncbi:lysozyme [Halomonas koreensis]|uniref:Lysozyme n=1 Tax=Halomonas koreensis TaxID=245385 RepID=A0ABU1G3L6_9GAMM|nr:lysozyme [Halomonas koreensis]MDR5867286.1 lysozyme [Halomonas koreensis]